MNEVWQRIRNWLETNAPDVLNSFQGGATDREIAEAEDWLSIQFPEDVKAFYRIHNGQKSYHSGFIGGREFFITTTNLR